MDVFEVLKKSKNTTRSYMNTVVVQDGYACVTNGALVMCDDSFLKDGHYGENRMKAFPELFLKYEEYQSIFKKIKSLSFEKFELNPFLKNVSKCAVIENFWIDSVVTQEFKRKLSVDFQSYKLIKSSEEVFLSQDGRFLSNSKNPCKSFENKELVWILPVFVEIK